MIADIQQARDDKAKIEKEISKLKEKLEKLNSRIDMKKCKRDEYNRTIEETEAAYDKIVQSFQALVVIARKEKDNLSKSKT